MDLEGGSKVVIEGVQVMEMMGGEGEENVEEEGLREGSWKGGGDGGRVGDVVGEFG